MCRHSLGLRVGGSLADIVSLTNLLYFITYCLVTLINSQSKPPDYHALQFSSATGEGISPDANWKHAYRTTPNNRVTLNNASDYQAN